MNDYANLTKLIYYGRKVGLIDDEDTRYLLRIRRMHTWSYFQPSPLLFMLQDQVNLYRELNELEPITFNTLSPP